MSNIGRWLAMRLIPVVSALGSLLGTASGAHATVDLTGSWKFTYSPPASVVIYATLVQSGTDLTITRNDLGTAAGTIDPVTGVFSFDLGPWTASGAPPGPEHLINGTGAADSLSFAGQENVCIYEVGLGWGCLTFDFNAVPGEPPTPTCGNGIVEAYEECDRGLSNGPTCCMNCQLVDQDADGICDLLDNCPQTPNPNQVDSDGDYFGNLCDTSTIGYSNGQFLFNSVVVAIKVPSTAAAPPRRLSVRGAFTGSLAVPTTLQLRDINALNIDLASVAAWTGKVCQTSASKITCVSPDGKLRIRLKQRAGDPTVHLKLIWRDPPLARPFVAPFMILSMHSPDGGRRSILGVCDFSAAGSVECRG